MKLLRTKDVLDILGVSRSTLHRWVRTGTFPRLCSVGGSSAMVYWLREVVEGWLEARRNSATAIPVAPLRPRPDKHKPKPRTRVKIPLLNPR